MIEGVERSSQVIRVMMAPPRRAAENDRQPIPMSWYWRPTSTAVWCSLGNPLIMRPVNGHAPTRLRTRVTPQSRISLDTDERPARREPTGTRKFSVNSSLLPIASATNPMLNASAPRSSLPVACLTMRRAKTPNPTSTPAMAPVASRPGHVRSSRSSLRRRCGRTRY
jgi:hypothetical protein